jgi:hypothetical protein
MMRHAEVRVVVVMLLFVLGMVLGRFAATGLDRLASDVEEFFPAWDEPASPIPPSLDPEIVALG